MLRRKGAPDARPFAQTRNPRNDDDVRKRPEKPILLLDRLTPLLVVPMLFLARAGFSVYYARPSRLLWRETFVARLDRLGVRMFDFQKVPDLAPYRLLFLKDALCRRMAGALFAKEGLFAALAKMFPGIDRVEDKLRVAVYDVLLGLTDGVSHLLFLAELLGERRNVRVLDIPVAALGTLRGQEARIRPLCPPLPAAFLLGTAMAGKGAAKAARLGLTAVKGLLSRRGAPSPAAKPVPALAPEGYAVAYFPHQTILYGNLFKKDQYYDPDPASPFHPSRILHVEVGNLAEPLRSRAVAHYQEHGIPTLFWSIPKTGAPRALGRFALFCLKNPCFLLAGGPHRCLRFGLSALLYLLFDAYGALVDAMPGLEVALVGYDYLFPVPLSLALQSRGIKVVATQERFIQAYYPDWRLVLDKYLVSGEETVERLRRYAHCQIDEITPIGLVRAEKIGTPRPAENGGRTMTVLVLDFHSLDDPVANRMMSTNHWAANRLFYRDILALAQSRPDVRFVIRGKDAQWRSLPFFRDVVAAMKRTPNVVVNTDYDRPDVSYALAGTADVVIAKHTSLGDECLARGIPVIFHDYGTNTQRLVASLFDYGSWPVFAQSFEELAAGLDACLSGEGLMPAEDFVRLRKRFYGGTEDGMVRARLGEALRASMRPRTGKRCTEKPAA